MEGLTALLDTLLWETHPLISNLIFLLCYNARERLAQLELEVEYTLLPLH